MIHLMLIFPIHFNRGPVWSQLSYMRTPTETTFRYVILSILDMVWIQYVREFLLKILSLSWSWKDLKLLLFCRLLFYTTGVLIWNNDIEPSWLWLWDLFLWDCHGKLKPQRPRQPAASTLRPPRGELFMVQAATVVLPASMKRFGSSSLGLLPSVALISCVLDSVSIIKLWHISKMNSFPQLKSLSVIN